MAAAAAKAAAEGKTLDAKSLASAPVKPVPASAPLHGHRPAAHQNRAGAEAPSRAPHGASKEPILKGIGTKAGGKYTPPAILRAVANAARNKEARAGAGSGATAAAVDASNPNRADWTCAYFQPCRVPIFGPTRPVSRECHTDRDTRGCAVANSGSQRR